MRVIMARADELKTSLGDLEFYTSDKPFIEHSHPGESYEMDKCITLFVCVEKKDEEDTGIPRKMSEKIKSILHDTDMPLVVIPFVHLTKTPSPPKVAYMYIKELAAWLEKTYAVSNLQFGWHRSLYADLITEKNGFEYITV